MKYNINIAEGNFGRYLNCLRNIAFLSTVVFSITNNLIEVIFFHKTMNILIKI